MSIPSRMQDRILVLSKLKQSAWGTLVSDANLQAGKRWAPNEPVFAEPIPAFWTNRHQSMKGHDYATERREVERNVSFGMSFDADTWLLGWAFAFGMGKVTSVLLGGGPGYKHTFKPLDPSADGKDLPVTTIYREWANVAAAKGRLHACGVRNVELTFPPSGVVQLAVEVIGSGQETTGALASPPAIPSLNLLHSNDMLFQFGAQGAPGDVSAEIVRGSVRFGFTWSPDEENRRAPGGSLYASRLWVGQPQPTLSFQRFVDDADATAETEWLAGTKREVKVTVAGAVIAGPDKHQIVIRGLAVVPEGIRKGRVNDKTIYEYTIGPDHWLKEGSNDVVTVEVQNTETSYLV